MDLKREHIVSDDADQIIEARRVPFHIVETKAVGRILSLFDLSSMVCCQRLEA